ncbi:MAG: hypothetical protein Q9162_006794 [Coniocarpon cinnabarinum]
MATSKASYLSDLALDNKVVLCTGGAGTICSAQVRALVHLGANACIIGRNVEKTEAAAKSISTVRPGSKIIGIGAVDVRKPTDLEKSAERCARELGSIDFVIAGAAGNFLAPMTQLSSNAFKSVMDIDAIGSYNTLKATMPYLVESARRCTNDGKSPSTSTGGRIIFVSATLHYIGTPLQTHVAAAKAAVDALSNNVAIEFGPRGITSNVIAPGPIQGTEGMARLSREDERTRIEKRIPSGRMGTLRDIADATVYLFSSSGDYINGHSLVVDGAAWRTGSIGQEGAFSYPDFLLGDDMVSGVAGGKKSKL